ncbi:MAG: PEP-CTERM sorting domain-containing protein [Acidovorax sp.]|uniref:PEP-CTERM sorting domain-containing protein n=1 Tax=Acidovorax sp. TaxID=1872122 RepID=UPI00391DBB97
MLKTLKVLLAGAALALASVSASAAVWTQTIDQRPDVYIGPSFTWTHDLTTAGYNAGSDSISSFKLSLKMYDDGDGICFFIFCSPDLSFEKAFADLPGSAADGLWEVDNSWYTTEGTLGMVATGLLSSTGKLEITLKSFLGDFYLDKSTLTATGKVPEPGALSLLGLGLAGLAFVRRRQQKQ